ncbi:MAG: hypothetical protein J6Y31_03295 [Bacteroidales bacterium]|nr:hypothetical protein [Bacteroidales bacterium]
MKKLIIILTAAAALFACTKAEVNNGREISFQIASGSVHTRATAGDVYSTSVPFGTYAWFNDTDEFMVNEQVAFVTPVWKTVDHTFYWPKTGAISFISYSPFKGSSNVAGTVPAITKTSITYTGLTAGNEDVMYADKVSCSSNVNEVTDNVAGGTDNGYNGVPTVFRHALAKLSFKVKLNFTEYDDAANGSHTEWEVTLNSFKIGGFKNTGDCALTLNADGSSWDKPVTTVGGVDYNVWTNVSGSTAGQELITTPVVLTTAEQDLGAASGFVIPQVLEAGAQTVEISAHIKTTLANGKVINEDYVKTIDISAISSLKAWQMNQSINYVIKFKPTAVSETDPHHDDPEDVVITFDPAVAQWEEVSTSATIQL